MHKSQRNESMPQAKGTLFAVGGGRGPGHSAGNAELALIDFSSCTGANESR